tara:strand:- start:123 stop:407 length:285 start_codon:yes stop_codon:yes gene_type:complete
MKLHARFAALYGWCPGVRGFTHGEVELGLMANMIKVQAQQGLSFVESIAGAFNSEALANLAERAGMPEKEIIRMKMQTKSNDNRSGNTGIEQWQ